MRPDQQAVHFIGSRLPIYKSGIPCWIVLELHDNCKVLLDLVETKYPEVEFVALEGSVLRYKCTELASSTAGSSKKYVPLVPFNEIAQQTHTFPLSRVTFWCSCWFFVLQILILCFCTFPWTRKTCSLETNMLFKPKKLDWMFSRHQLANKAQTP